MIKVEYSSEVEINLITAIRMSLNNCINNKERMIAGNTIIEFLSALVFSDNEIIEMLKLSGGVDKETDDYIDYMITSIMS